MDVTRRRDTEAQKIYRSDAWRERDAPNTLHCFVSAPSRLVRSVSRGLELRRQMFFLKLKGNR